MYVLVFILACLALAGHGRKLDLASGHPPASALSEQQLQNASTVVDFKLEKSWRPEPRRASRKTLAMLLLPQTAGYTSAWQTSGIVRHARHVPKAHSVVRSLYPSMFGDVSGHEERQPGESVAAGAGVSAGAVVAAEGLGATSGSVTATAVQEALQIGNLVETALGNTSKLDILQQLSAILDDQDNKTQNVVILGTRQMPYLNQKIVELLSYALVLSDNHLYTSGATGTHAAAIRGALRANRPELLTVILPQTIEAQPTDVQEALFKVREFGSEVIELKHNDMSLAEAARLCNYELLDKGDWIIVWAFHSSGTLLSTIEEAQDQSKLATCIYLD